MLFRVQISFSSKEEKNWEVDRSTISWLSGNVRLKLVVTGDISTLFYPDGLGLSQSLV